MKREIKFRAWDNEKKIMTNDFVISANGDRIYGWNYELMQFTGLKDKNGKEIYEGDIIHNDNGSPLIGKDDKCLYLVKWQEGEYENNEWLYKRPGFEFNKIGKGQHIIFNQSQIEIVGNVFENPELL